MELENPDSMHEAMILLHKAYCYLLGKGVKQSDSEANKFFHQAADRGLYEEIFQVGLNHLQGKGVEKSETEALNYFQRAGDQGYALAYYLMGKWIKHSALGFLKKAADMDFAPAQHDLTEFYRFDRVVIVRDTAIKLYYLAANQGYEPAAAFLDQYLPSWKDCQDHLELAFRHDKQLAEQGSLAATKRVAERYRLGKGVDKNISIALDYFKRLSESGNASAHLQMAEILEELYPDGSAQPLIFDYLKKAADAGDVEANFKLGQYYFLGGVLKRTKHWHTSIIQMQPKRCTSQL